MTTHRIAVIPGDGIGTETVPEGIRVLGAAARKFSIDLQWEWFQWEWFDFASCDYYLKHGKMFLKAGLTSWPTLTRFFSGPSAGRIKSRTTYHSGALCCSSGDASTNM